MASNLKESQGATTILGSMGPYPTAAADPSPHHDISSSKQNPWFLAKRTQRCRLNAAECTHDDPGPFSGTSPLRGLWTLPLCLGLATALMVVKATRCSSQRCYRGYCTGMARGDSLVWSAWSCMFRALR